MPRRSRLAIVFAFVASLALSDVTARAQAARFEALPLYPGGGDAEAMGVSHDGSIVVGQASTGPVRTPDQPPRQAVVWRDGQVTALGDLEGGDVLSIARGVSADGSVVVGSGNLWSGSAWRYRPSTEGQAVRWVNGAISALPVTVPNFTDSSALAVSADGSVIVGKSGGDAYRWSNGVYTRVFAYDGDVSGRASGVSADGSVVVGDTRSFSASGLQIAFRWQNGVLTPLPGDPDYVSTVAHAVSADGRVVVGRVYDGFDTESAVRWDGTAMQHLSGVRRDAEALAVSGDGSVVVGTFGEPDFLTAFIWDAEHNARPLQDVLENDYGIKLPDWRLAAATGVSDDGKTIVGYGYRPLDGNYVQAFRVTLPEPAGMLTFVLPAVLTALKRRPRGQRPCGASGPMGADRPVRGRVRVTRPARARPHCPPLDETEIIRAADTYWALPRPDGV